MQPVLFFDHRAVLMALAVTLDFDYFSRHAGPPFDMLLHARALFPFRACCDVTSIDDC